MNTLFLIAFLFTAEPTAPPVKPAEIPWPGGKWTGDDADKGKEFPKGAFQYTPRADWNAYLKASHEWIGANVGTPQIAAFNIAPTLAALGRPADPKRPCLMSNGKIAAFGGTGTVSAAYWADGVVTKLELADVDFEQLRAYLNMQLPIRITGAIGKLAGAVNGSKGRFVGTEVRTTGVTVRRMTLDIDFATGAWSAFADTNRGDQNLTGRTRP